MIMHRIQLCLLLALLFSQGIATGDDPNADTDAQATAFFEAKIRPVLVTHCYKCHSSGAGKSAGGLLLDSRQSSRTGGDRGPAVVPGDLDASLLLTAISHTNADLKMPPKKDRLSQSVIDDFKSWIRMGAVDPREAEATKDPKPPVDIEAGRRFWAFQKPVDHKPPVTTNPDWMRRGRDHNNKGYSIWMAGGGVKGGINHGATDDFGYQAVEKPMHIHDWHATVLHLLGLDHERLTFNYGGRDFRLTDVHGNVAKEILA